MTLWWLMTWKRSAWRSSASAGSVGSAAAAVAPAAGGTLRSAARCTSYSSAEHHATIQPARCRSRRRRSFRCCSAMSWTSWCWLAMSPTMTTTNCLHSHCWLNWISFYVRRTPGRVTTIRAPWWVAPPPRRDCCWSSSSGRRPTQSFCLVCYSFDCWCCCSRHSLESTQYHSDSAMRTRKATSRTALSVRFRSFASSFVSASRADCRPSSFEPAKDQNFVEFAISWESNRRSSWKPQSAVAASSGPPARHHLPSGCETGSEVWRFAATVERLWKWPSRD